MILIEKGPAFCQVGENQMATQPIDRFVVYYGTPSMGAVQAYLLAEKQNVQPPPTEGEPTPEPTFTQVDMGGNPTLMNFTEEDFKGQDILVALHPIYLEYLQGLNPKLTFKSTL